MKRVGGKLKALAYFLSRYRRSCARRREGVSLKAEAPSTLDEGLEKRVEPGGFVALIDLRVGERAEISFVEGARAIVKRLVDMGLTRGTEVKVLKVAPFNGPIEVLVRGSRLIISRELASKVFVIRKD